MLKAVFLLATVSILLLIPFSVDAKNTYYVYIDELPSWADYAVNVMYDSTKYWEEPNPELKFLVVDNPSDADFKVQWVKDFGGEQHIGYAYGKQFVEVGLGDSLCYGKWQPYSANYVNQIMTHEIGHVLGLDHSNDVNSVMYPTAIHFEYGSVEDEFTLTENYAQFYSPCTSKDVTSFSYWVSVDDPTYGFDVYYVPSVESFNDWADGKPFQYYSDKECFGKNYRAYGGTCNGVAKGSGLLVIMDSKLTNPLTIVTMKTQEISSTKGFSSPKIAIVKPSFLDLPPPISIKPTITTTTKPIVIPEQESKSEYKNKASFSQSTYKTKIDKLKSGIETAENSLSGLIYQSPDAQKKIDQAWKIRWSALEKLDQANEKWKIGVSEIDKQNFRTAIINFKHIDADSESIGNYLKLISSAIEGAEKTERDYQSQKKSISPPKEDKFCFLFWCW